MAHACNHVLLGLLLIAGSASAATVGSMTGKPVPGHALAVNIPFAVDQPADRACASANVRYGSTPVPHVTLHVQGQGLKRNLLVTSRTNVSEQPVRVDVRVGCGAKAVTRRFVVQPATQLAKAPPIIVPRVRQSAVEVPIKSSPKPVGFMTPSEPLFPPPAAPEPDSALQQALQKAQADAATAIAQLAAVRKELAAVLDVERRTSQTLINADHEVRDAQAEAARMRLVLKIIAGILGLAAGGVAWLEVQRVLAKRRTYDSQPPQEPTILEGAGMPA